MAGMGRSLAFLEDLFLWNSKNLQHQTKILREMDFMGSV